MPYYIDNKAHNTADYHKRANKVRDKFDSFLDYVTWNEHIVDK